MNTASLLTLGHSVWQRGERPTDNLARDRGTPTTARTQAPPRPITSLAKSPALEMRHEDQANLDQNTGGEGKAGFQVSYWVSIND